MESSEEISTIDTAAHEVKFFDVMPPNPTKECYAPWYGKCHRCKKWFTLGEAYYGFNPQARMTKFIHGSQTIGSSFSYENSDTRYICPKCESKCPDDCECNGPRHRCNMCEEVKRGMGKHMFSPQLCMDCHHYFMLGKEVVRILIEERPQSLEDLYEKLNLSK